MPGTKRNGRILNLSETEIAAQRNRYRFRIYFGERGIIRQTIGRETRTPFDQLERLEEVFRLYNLVNVTEKEIASRSESRKTSPLTDAVDQLRQSYEIEIKTYEIGNLDVLKDKAAMLREALLEFMFRHLPSDAVMIRNFQTIPNRDESNGRDFIDLDVFGSPYPFLDSAIKKLSRKQKLRLIKK